VGGKNWNKDVVERERVRLVKEGIMGKTRMAKSPEANTRFQ